MIFDIYYPFIKDGKLVPGVRPTPMEWADIVNREAANPQIKERLGQIRSETDSDIQAEIKKCLPAINFVGRSRKTRAAKYMEPTQLFMVDVDHCEDACGAWNTMMEEMGNDWICDHIMVAHLTPRLGLHIIGIAQPGFTTLQENMDWLNETLQLERFGDYDAVTKDFARVSFLFAKDELLFENARLYLNTEPVMLNYLKNKDYESLTPNPSPKGEGNFKGEGDKEVKGVKNDTPVITDEEKAEYDVADWRGNRLKVIVDAWVKFRGKPGPQEVHNYYNEMVKYFRNIMGNNKRLIFYLLPKFGHSDEECWSQVKSICKANTLSRIDKPFFLFLVDKGFYVNDRRSKVDEYMLSEDPDVAFDDMPTLPPVFREFVRSAPKDFRIPAINALMPILGTLTSYLQAIFPYDDAYHTTSFFSIIYAPPGTGKGFVNRFNFLFDDLRLRDQVQSAREMVYLRFINRKSQNEKSPEMPHTSLRIIPPKNSEAEFLQKQKDNEGYHMFTYAAEMDSWAKGEKAAGGNKSDMIRIAWDNGEYGQQFKSAQTFKGKVNLFWNVLITGTQDQVECYFKNVENGLVTRCAFTSIDNQQFQLASYWKPISKRGMQVIRNFMRRCDENSYEEPCTIDPTLLDTVSDDDFDKEIDWKFKFRRKQTMKMDWIMPTINAFNEEQCKRASMDLDTARDVFRRRCGVRGFRLALLCTALYPTLNERSKKTIIAFVKWWMEVDIENMLRLWGAKYNEQSQVMPKLYQRNAYDSLKDEFTRNDLYLVMKQQGIQSPVKTIVYQWKREGYIQQVSKDTFKKTKKQ